MGLPRIRKAIEATAQEYNHDGPLDRVCITWPTIEMIGAGYNIYVVEDCCGATSPAAQEAALSRMVQAGAVRLTNHRRFARMQRDWKNKEHYNASWDYSNSRPARMASASNMPTR